MLKLQIGNLMKSIFGTGHKFFQSDSQLPPFRTALIIFGLGLVLRIVAVYVFSVDITPGDDPYYYLKIASNILAGEGYHEGYLLAYRPPLYPYFLASIFSIFGQNLEVVRIIQAILGAGMCVFVFLIGRSVASYRVGVVAGLFCAVYPHLIHYSVQLWSEQMFAFLLMFAILAMLMALRRLSVGWLALSGLSFGLAALTREVALFVLAGVFLWFLLIRKERGRVVLEWSIVLTVALLAITPWTIRNYRAFGRFVLISTNSGVNFYIGNNPEATGTFNWKLPPGTVWNQPSPHGANEIEASRLGFKYGREFIENHPGRFLLMIGMRLKSMLWLPFGRLSEGGTTIFKLANLAWFIMYGLAFIGTVLAPFVLWRYWRQLSLFYVSIVMLLLPHLVTYGAARYRLPLIPFMALLLAALVSSSWKARDRIEQHEWSS